MADLKLHGSPISTNTLRVLSCLYEKELEFQFVSLSAVSQQELQLFIESLSPLGLMPAFEHGDLKVFESRAITQHICHEYHDQGTKLIPKEPRKMAIVGTWMEVEAHQFDPPSSKLAWLLVYNYMFGMVTDEALVVEKMAELGRVLDVYEERLSSNKYLGGEAFSLADLHHCPNLQVLMPTKAKVLFESRPHVSAWCDDILGRPAWKKVAEMFEKRRLDQAAVP